MKCFSEFAAISTVSCTYKGSFLTPWLRSLCKVENFTHKIVIFANLISLYQIAMESQHILSLKDLKKHLVPTPCHGQKHLPLDQVAQIPVQPGLENFQE